MKNQVNKVQGIMTKTAGKKKPPVTKKVIKGATTRNK